MRSTPHQAVRTIVGRHARRVAYAGVALGIAGAGWWTIPPDAQVIRASAEGAIRLEKGTDAIEIRLGNMLPGDTGTGHATIGNVGLLDGSLSLDVANVEEQPGSAGGRLSDAVRLVIQETTGTPRTLYAGTVGRMNPIDLGEIGSGDRRRFSFSVALLDGGRPRALDEGDNRLQDARLAFDMRWRAAGDAPAARPDSRSTGSALSLVITPAPSGRRTCSSRRRFVIRVRERRGRKLRSAIIRLNGRRLAVRRRNGRLTAVVDLRGKPRRTASVRIVAWTSKGVRLTGRRTYHPCLTRNPRVKVPPL